MEHMPNELESVPTEELFKRRAEILALIETKKQGRQKMIEEGLEMEDESEDLDLQDLEEELRKIEEELARRGGDDRPQLS